MDEEKLKRILENMEIPSIDENAQKRALNLSLAAFEEEKRASLKKSKNKSQGFSFLSRLMAKTTNIKGEKTMEQKIEKKRNNKLIYGGMMTAVALVLIAAPQIMRTMNETMNDTEISSANNISAPAAVQNAAKFTGSDMVMESLEELAIASAPMPAPVSMQAPLGRFVKEGKGSAPKLVKARSALTRTQETGATMILAESDYFSEPSFQDQTSLKNEGRDKFESFEINPIKMVSTEPVSTFSVDVDTAAYSFIRKSLNQGRMPHKDAVRIEEMVNYFNYDYPVPETRAQPFKPTITVTPSPWTAGKKLIHIGIKGYDIQEEARPRTNLVFLLDVSGSMNAADKLPLLKSSLKMLLNSLNEDDTIAIAVYAGAAGTVLEPTPASKKTKILAALDRLSAGGSTAGAAGINLAYQLAEENFDEETVNRIILATDGDFNVGTSSTEELKALVERKRKSGVFLSVLGFGMGNFNDHLMQTLAQNGNGVAAYIDNLNEARKVLVDEASSTLFTIAKDVKIQMEFNPATVAEYRLIGYETRGLKREDFNNDKIDAGDIGAGHTVTAIYEITPVGSEALSVDPLRYDEAQEKIETKTVMNSDFTGEYGFLKIRYKLPNEDKSKLITTPITTQSEYGTCPAMAKCQKAPIPQATLFSTAVAGFGQLLKDSPYTGSLTYDEVINMAKSAKGEDDFGYRAEFINLVRLAKTHEQ